ncbi:unnamed protein product [Orchesella dallaii]|uniref:Kazal-like domain-containing protein n=1 Tax=Orchesella dallaii TaxID=48710 RepID=A0ABP1QN32_9HEXA
MGYRWRLTVLAAAIICMSDCNAKSLVAPSNQSAGSSLEPLTTTTKRTFVCKCEDTSEPICANNGVTYKNLCRFECAKHKVTRKILSHAETHLQQFYPASKTPHFLDLPYITMRSSKHGQRNDKVRTNYGSGSGNRIDEVVCPFFVSFLVIILQSQTIPLDSFFSNLFSLQFKDCQCVKDCMPSASVLKDLGQVISFHQEVASRRFLFALECVVLTDIISNTIRMNSNGEFQFAMLYEGPVIIKGALGIVIGTWIFNLCNKLQYTKHLETLLVVLVFAWILVTLIDVCFFNKNNIRRTNDYFGYRFLKDITWFQVDVDVVAYTISILLYSQWKTVHSIAFTEDIAHADFKNESDCESDSEFLDSPNSSDIDRLEFNAECILILFISMTAIRFTVNFKDVTSYANTLKTTPRTPQMVSAEQRHSRRLYRRDLPFNWADNPDANVGDIQILGIAEIVRN